MTSGLSFRNGVEDNLFEYRETESWSQNTEAIYATLGLSRHTQNIPALRAGLRARCWPKTSRHSPLNSRTLVMAFLRGSSIYCITNSEIPTTDRLVFSSICISTATISSFGAIVQIVNWYKKLQLSESRRILSPSPTVLFSLALADLFTCVGK